MSLKIKDLPVNERPRERLLKYGCENISNVDLLSILLKTGVKGENVTLLASRLLKSCTDITDFKDINKEMLVKINGIGDAKAIEILAAIELGRRIFVEKRYEKKKKYNNSKIIYDDHKHLFYDKKQEYFYCLYLNTKKEIIERKLLFMGTLNQACVHPREIFKEAYRLSASSIICMHNHPGGDARPSNEDIVLTKSLMEIGRLQQIPVVDHIIFGGDSYYSFYEGDVRMSRNV